MIAAVAALERLPLVMRRTMLPVVALALGAAVAHAQVAAPAKPAPVATPRSASVAVAEVQQPLVAVGDLPLNELPASGNGHLFAVLMTGDGGWAALDQGVSDQLTARGIPVVGFNQRVYLWSGKTPDQAGADLSRIIAWYRAKWHRDSVVVIGYSRGAGTAPFAVNRLPEATRGAVRAVVLIGAEHGAGFHFRMRDLLRSGPGPDDVPVMPELKKLGGTTLMCFYGEEEKDTLCPELAPPAIVVKMGGGHHLDGAYEVIGQRIARELTGR